MPAAVADRARVGADHLGRLSSRGPASSVHAASGACLRERHQVLGDFAHRDGLHPRARGGVERAGLHAREHERRELVELRRPQDRPGHVAGLDQPLL